MKKCFNPYSPGFSIYFEVMTNELLHKVRFNPYSPGFSIYLETKTAAPSIDVELQSLFTWIFYLF